jgi:hypothetical protein
MRCGCLFHAWIASGSGGWFPAGAGSDCSLFWDLGSSWSLFSRARLRRLHVAMRALPDTGARESRGGGMIFRPSFGYDRMRTRLDENTIGRGDWRSTCEMRPLPLYTYICLIQPSPLASCHASQCRFPDLEVAMHPNPGNPLGESHNLHCCLTGPIATSQHRCCDALRCSRQHVCYTDRTSECFLTGRPAG